MVGGRDARSEDAPVGCECMPLTRAELQALREEYLADDIEIDDEMLEWSREEASVFFESGGFL